MKIEELERKPTKLDDWILEHFMALLWGILIITVGGLLAVGILVATDTIKTDADRDQQQNERIEQLEDELQR